MIVYLQVALAEALADEAEGLVEGLMEALKDLKAELKGAVYLCPMMIAARPNSSCGVKEHHSLVKGTRLL
jgi:hypothetical protein